MLGKTVFFGKKKSIDAYTLLLIQSNTTHGSINFVDEAKNAPVTVYENAQHSTEIAPIFGTSSMKFDGTNDRLTVPDSNDWFFGMNNFTIDVWFKPINLSITQNLCGQSAGSASTSSPRIRLVGNKLDVVFYNSGANIEILGSTALVINTWYHFAFMRSGNTLYLFLNGLPEGTANVTGISSNESVAAFGVGGISTSSAPANGYMQSFRISNVARYPTGGFTPNNFLY
ncbi:MAG: LamG domain-containing protein [Magnetococcus sp. DMHC-6]